MNGNIYTTTGGLYSHIPNTYPASLTAPNSASASSSAAASNESGSTSPPNHTPSTAPPKRVGGKSNVSSACGPCKRAHLACDVSRPCKRCCNLGKESLCEDVPHKKRGRPKQPKDALPGPFARPSVSSSEPDARWRDWNSASDGDTPQSYRPYPPSQPLHREASGFSSTSYSPATGVLPFPSPPLFTMFTTTDMRVLRCTASSLPLTGFPSQRFLNTSLLDWVIPHDRHLIEMERGRLMANPMSPEQLHTNRETQAAIAHTSEEDLISPIDGMREPYPNQSVRFMLSDQQYSLFNVRLHVGGGLGGSLWHPDTIGKVYFVISLLLLPSSPQPALLPIGQPISTTGPTRLVPSLGCGETATPSANIARRVSYITPPLQHLSVDGPNVSGVSSSPYSSFPGSDGHTPPAGHSPFSANFDHAPFLVSMPSPISYTLHSPQPMHATAGSGPHPPAIYPVPRSPKSDPQVYTLQQAKAERETHMTAANRHSFSHGFAGQIRPLTQGYFDPRLMQAYRPPPEAGGECEIGVSHGQTALGKEEVKTEVEDRPTYMSEPLGPSLSAGVDHEIVMGQHAAGLRFASIEVGGGFGGYTAGA